MDEKKSGSYFYLIGREVYLFIFFSFAFVWLDQSARKKKLFFFSFCSANQSHQSQEKKLPFVRFGKTGLERAHTVKKKKKLIMFD
jgi:hypothetical protein